ncbi:MAG: paraquat-inducible protein A [Pseudomonadota bacterium]
MSRRQAVLRAATLAVLVLYPISWFAPLLRAGFLPLFGLSEISVMTGIVSLLQTDVVLAIIVAVFALIAPMVKMLWMVALQWGLVGRRALGWMEWMGRLAMADLFLIAIYITVAKGIGVGRVEVAWGLYLFSGCILASLALGHATVLGHNRTAQNQ